MIFINCTVDKSIGLFKPFFPVSVPYGIAYLMAMLETQNIEYGFVDMQVHKHTRKKIQQLTDKLPPPHIFSLSFLTEATSAAIAISDWIKENIPDAVVIWGGIHVTALPEDCLEQKSVDFVYIGEAEAVIVDIYQKLKKRKSIHDVPGIGYKKNSKYIINERAKPIINLDDIPIIPYHIFTPYKKYEFGYISTSRGCPYNCTFCNNNLTGIKKVRFKSTSRVIEELKLLIETYGCRDITFYDDNFLVNKWRLFDLCKKIKENNLHKKAIFMFETRIKDVKPDLLACLYDAGFRTVFYGIETVSEHLLQTIGKTETKEEIIKAVQISKQIGYKVMANFLYFLPNEHKKDRKACVDFSIKHNIDVVKFNNIVPYPGTSMYEKYKYTSKIRTSLNYENYNSQMVLVRPFWEKCVFPFKPDNTPDYILKNEILWSYLRFFIRYNMLKSVLGKRKWGSLIFRYGNNTVEVIKHIPAVIVLLADLSIKGIIMLFTMPLSWFYHQGKSSKKENKGL